MSSSLPHAPVLRVSRALKSVSTRVALGIRWRLRAWMCAARLFRMRVAFLRMRFSQDLRASDTGGARVGGSIEVEGGGCKG